VARDGNTVTEDVRARIFELAAIGPDQRHSLRPPREQGERGARAAVLAEEEELPPRARREQDHGALVPAAAGQSRHPDRQRISGEQVLAPKISVVAIHLGVPLS
jgi:hypothetical protein